MVDRVLERQLLFGQDAEAAASRFLTMDSPMQDHYYSKKSGRYFPTRLDVLLYAHDGRGFGHVSRTAAVGLALKRLYPEYRALLVTGSARTAMLIGPGELDWMKLPSYRTVLKNGVSEGRDSAAGFYKSVLGNHRAALLAAMITILRPRCVLVDHNPFGKRDELVEALEHGDGSGCQWVLGLRGIIGDDKRLWSTQSSELVGRRYREILWYGDSSILGTLPLKRVQDHFPIPVTEVGYVSRVSEIRFLLGRSAAEKDVACTISLPWLSEAGELLIGALHEALMALGAEHGTWRIFVPDDHLEAVEKRFGSADFCEVEPIGEAYVDSLMRSRSALVYGGYNSLLDAASGGMPTLVLLRSTRDNEQQEHLERLQGAVGTSWRVITEDQVCGRTLKANLRHLLSAENPEPPAIDCRGAERAAGRLHQILSGGD